MKIHLLLTACLLCFSCLAQAAPVTVDKAKAEAFSFFTARGVAVQKGASRVQASKNMLTLAYTAMASSNNADYYVFNRNAGVGYVVVAGDDRMPAVLGYSDTGNFVYNNMPDNMKAFLAEYAREAQWLRNHPSVVNSNKVATYDTEVTPLLRNITWNQTKPYNNLCPNDLPTGCVATAMGQVMYYYRYPEHGVGSKTYQWNNQQLTANFGATTYEWDQMQDRLTANSPAEAKKAVATLLYHIGVSVNMNYGPAETGGSGASPSYIAPSLVNYFGYDKGCHLRSREYYTKTEWEATVRDELNHARPVLYGGYTQSASGHSFVCDGYNREGYYHINWGWDGLNNGYFLLTALDPKSKGTGGGAEGEGYNYNQTMVVGIQKPVEGSKPVYSFVFKYVDSTPQTVTRLQSVTLQAYGIHTDGIDPLDVQLCFQMYNGAGKVVATSSVSSQNIPLGESVKYLGEFSLPDSIKDGTYELRLAGHINGVDSDGVFNLLHAMVGEYNYYRVTVKDGQVTYTPQGLPKLSLQSLQVEPNPIISKEPFTVTAVIRNDGGEFDGKLAYALIHPDGEKKSYYAPDKSVNIKAGETATVTFTDSAVLYGNDNYTLQLVKRDGVQHLNLGDPITVKVVGGKEKANLAAVDYLDFVTGADNAKRDDIDVVASLHNTGGDFSGKLTCLIFKDASATGTPLASLDTVQVDIARDEYKTVEIRGRFPDATDKGTYYACLYNVEDDDFVNPIKYAGTTFTIRDDASNENPRLYLKKQISFGDKAQATASNLKVYATILNTGGTYNGTIIANFYNVNGWTPLATLTKQVTIGYGETVVVELQGSSSKLVDGKSYDVGVTYGDKEETDWKSYAQHAGYSNARVTIVSPSGIGSVTAADKVTVKAVYSVTGKRLSAMQHGINLVVLSNGKTIKVIR